MFKRPVALLVSLCFIFSNVPSLQAQDLQGLELSAPGSMIHLSVPLNPPSLQGIKVHSDNPFQFDFILNNGNGGLSQAELKSESARLIKYFLAGLTVPDNDLWVNLSPYEKARIIPPSFGVTQMGRDLLAEDYLLKQLTSSLIYPEDATGKEFWKRIYQEAAKKFHTTDIPVNTFNKVWIVPQSAEVYENVEEGTAFVTQSKLKVMLEQDYLSLTKHVAIEQSAAQKTSKDTSALGNQIVREIIIPQLTKEVNEGRNFARLRQVYSSLILATWFKRKMIDSILNDVYSDKNKVAGVTVKDPNEKEKIYQLYIQAFKKGVYNYIKEEQDPVSRQMVPRHYFSGGVELTKINMDQAMKTTSNPEAARELAASSKNLSVVTAEIAPTGTSRRGFWKSVLTTLALGAVLCTAASCGGGGGGGNSGQQQPLNPPPALVTIPPFHDPASILDTFSMNPTTGYFGTNVIPSGDNVPASAQMFTQGSRTFDQALGLLYMDSQGGTSTASAVLDDTYGMYSDPSLGLRDTGYTQYQPSYPLTYASQLTPMLFYDWVYLPNWNTPGGWPQTVTGTGNTAVVLAALQVFSKNQDPTVGNFINNSLKGLAVNIEHLQAHMGGGLKNGSTDLTNQDTVANWMGVLAFHNAHLLTPGDEMQGGYGGVAQVVYSWMPGLYSKADGVFADGATSPDNGQTWNLKPANRPAYTTGVIPVHQVIQDQPFGMSSNPLDQISGQAPTTAGRLAFLDAIITKTEQLTAFTDAQNNITGFRWVRKDNCPSDLQDVISIPYTSQMALLYLQMEKAYTNEGDSANANRYATKYNVLTTNLWSWLEIYNGKHVFREAYHTTDKSPAEGIVYDSTTGAATSYGYTLWSSIMPQLAADGAYLYELPTDQAMASRAKGSLPAFGSGTLSAAESAAVVKKFKQAQADQADQAMFSGFTKGGIDLTPAQMDLVVRSFTSVLGKQNNLRLKFDPAMHGMLMKAAGFEPVIVNMQPLKSLPGFLGFNQEAPKTAKI